MDPRFIVHVHLKFSSCSIPVATSKFSRNYGESEDLCIRSTMLVLQELQDSKLEGETAEEHFAELTARLEQCQNKVWILNFPE